MPKVYKTTMISKMNLLNYCYKVYRKALKTTTSFLVFIYYPYFYFFVALDMGTY